MIPGLHAVIFLPVRPAFWTQNNCRGRKVSKYVHSRDACFSQVSSPVRLSYFVVVAFSVRGKIYPRTAPSIFVHRVIIG